MKIHHSKLMKAVGTLCVASSCCVPATSTMASSLLTNFAHLYGLFGSLNKPPQANPDAPNFITIVLDDMGHSDFGYLGGEIPTPNIDALADTGIKLTSFYAAPASTPSRAMLFTGKDNHLVGIARMRRYHNEQEERYEVDENGNIKLDQTTGRPIVISRPGYEDELTDDYPFFKVLRDGGYYTMMTGKWDVGGEDPYDRKFFNTTRAFLVPGGDMHFSNMAGVDWAGNSVPPGTMVPSRSGLKANLVYTENGKALPQEDFFLKDGTTKYEVNKFPKDFYSIDYYTEMAIEMLESRDTSKPFYLNISHIAPHTPLQAPADLIQSYIPLYSQGWDYMIEQRFNKMKATGLLPADTVRPNRPADIPAWDSLDSNTQMIEAKRMAIYAAMIDKIDQNIGRLVAYLESIGEYDNTVIAVFSDNGAESANAAFNAEGRRNFLLNNMDMSYENMGNWNSHISMSRGWAWVQSAPYNKYKASTFEGGIRTASFLHYPRATTSEITYDGITSIMDIAPTFLEMAGLEFVPPPEADAIPQTSRGDLFTPGDPNDPTSPFNSRTDRQYGCSMAGLFESGLLANDCSKNRRIGWEIDGTKGFRWDVAEEKTITVGPPNRRTTLVHEEGQWKLSMVWGEGERYYFFDLAQEKFERHELEPRNEMKGRIWDAYLEYARVNNIISVGNPIVNLRDPNSYILEVKGMASGGGGITLEGLREMSPEEVKEVLIETEPLADPTGLGR